MNICACSAFRSATSYMTRYFGQMAGLQRLLDERGDILHLVISDGDHTDNTRAMLPGWMCQFDSTLIHYDHGHPNYGSVVNLDRFAALARVWNRIWAQIPDNADAVVFVEADLEWCPDSIMGLIDDLHEWPAVAPMIRLRREGWHISTFYDNWAFRRDGEHISAAPPYFPGWDMRTPIQVDSAGSCLAIRGDLARRLTWPAEDVIVGVCRQINELGGAVWLNLEREVIHL